MISGVVYLLRIFKMFHGIMNNPVFQHLYWTCLWWNSCHTFRRYQVQVEYAVALQVGRSRFRLPMVSLEFFIDIDYDPGVDTASNRNEYQKYFLVVRRPVRRAEKHITFICRMSWNVEASDSWKSLGLSRPVMELLYLLPGSSMSW